MGQSTKENAKRLEELMAPMMQLMHRFTAQMSRLEDFTLAQHRVLMMVFHLGPMTIKQMQEKLSVAQSTASEMIDRLVHQGWMERKKKPEDRRITVFSLTDKATQFLKEKKAERMKVNEKLLMPLTLGEQQSFLDSLEMILNRHAKSGTILNTKGFYGEKTPCP